MSVGPPGRYPPGDGPSWPAADPPTWADAEAGAAPARHTGDALVGRADDPTTGEGRPAVGWAGPRPSGPATGEAGPASGRADDPATGDVRPTDGWANGHARPSGGRAGDPATGEARPSAEWADGTANGHARPSGGRAGDAATGEARPSVGWAGPRPSGPATGRDVDADARLGGASSGAGRRPSTADALTGWDPFTPAPSPAADRPGAADGPDDEWALTPAARWGDARDEYDDDAGLDDAWYEAGGYRTDAAAHTGAPAPGEPAPYDDAPAGWPADPTGTSVFTAGATGWADATALGAEPVAGRSSPLDVVVPTAGGRRARGWDDGFISGRHTGEAEALPDDAWAAAVPGTTAEGATSYRTAYRPAPERRSRGGRDDARPATAPPPRRPVLGVAGTVATLTAALLVGWIVLVVLRSPTADAGTDLAVRIDATIAETLLAERVLSFAYWIGSVSTLLAIGGTIFRLWIVPPHVGAVGEDGVVRAQSRKPSGGNAGDATLRGAATVGIVAAATVIPLRAMALSGGHLAAATDLDTLWFVLTSRFGDSFALRAVGLATLLVALADGPRAWRGAAAPRLRPGLATRLVEPLLGRTARRRSAFVVGTGVVLTGYAMTGHPQATDPWMVHVAAQAMHVTVAAAWFGGVTFLAIEMRQQWRRGSARYTGEVIARFSAMAEVTIILAAVTGLLLANSQIHAPTAVLESAYGRAFVGKMMALGIVLAIGGYNQRKLVPAIAEREQAEAWDHLRRAVAIEVTLIALGGLLMTAAMTSGGF